MKINDKDAKVLQHIVKHADEIADTINFFGKSKDKYLSNHIYRNPCTMALQSMGENAKLLSENFINHETEVLWKEMIGIRSFIAHAYDFSTFNHDIVWQTLINDIPKVRNKCASILKENQIDIPTVKHIKKGFSR